MTRAALLVAAAAALLPCAPSDAVGGRWCDPGYTGVVVYDAGGDLVTACVRTSDVPDVVGAVHGVAAYVDAYVERWLVWAEENPDCDGLPPFEQCRMETPPLVPPLEPF